MPHKIRGFTLIELAIVLVIVGLLLGAVLGIGMAQIQNSKITATKLKQETIKLGLVSYLARNNRLPCPATPNLLPGNPFYGQADPSAGCTATIIAGGIATGIVPFVTLGITDENATDGYYNRFTYHVSIPATQTNAQTVSGIKGLISTYPFAPPVAVNMLNQCTPTGGNLNPCLAVAIIVSHGNNGFGGYTRDGSPLAAPTGIDEMENSNNDSQFVIKDFSDSPANPFDDILLPLSPSDVLLPLTIHGAIDGVNTVLNKDFANITASIVASAVVARSGASPNISYNIPNFLPILPANTLNDPWGMPLVYNRFAPSVSAGTPSNMLVYTITSTGPDTVVGGNDDVIMNVFAAELQAQFGKVGW